MAKGSWTGCLLIVLATGFVLCSYAQDAPERSAAPTAASAPLPASTSTDDSPLIPADSPQVDPLEVWIDALAIAESGNRQWVVHRDRDGQLYYGCLQFQERTFLTYVRKFHLLKKGTRAEAMN